MSIGEEIGEYLKSDEVAGRDVVAKMLVGRSEARVAEEEEALTGTPSTRCSRCRSRKKLYNNERVTKI